MKRFCFILGTQKTLNVLDVYCVLKNNNIDYSLVNGSDEVLIFDFPDNTDILKIANEFGSVQKIVEIFESLPSTNFLNNFLDEIKKEDYFQKWLPSGEKVNFGISLYNLGGDSYSELTHQVSFLCKQIKAILEKSGKKSGFLFIKGEKLSSVSVKKNNLLEKGFEFVICVDKNEIFLGKTIMVQDFESYSLRDFGRPGRDDKSGMIPPKLAKMMINFAGKNKESIFLDPFCGSGTFLQEEVLLNYKNLNGTDLEPKAVDDTLDNLEWLFENYPQIKKEDYIIKVQKAEVGRLGEYFGVDSIDAIITEPYLGSPKVRLFQPERLRREIGILEDLYFRAFREFNKVLKKDGVIVIIFPIFRFGTLDFKLRLAKIFQMGFKTRKLADKDLIEKLDLQITDRDSIIFSRPDQTIEREIFVFERKV
jgi:tRNA G10  N-methylase Trm11